MVWGGTVLVQDPVQDPCNIGSPQKPKGISRTRREFRRRRRSQHGNDHFVFPAQNVTLVTKMKQVGPRWRRAGSVVCAILSRFFREDLAFHAA